MLTKNWSFSAYILPSKLVYIDAKAASRNNSRSISQNGGPFGWLRGRIFEGDVPPHSQLKS